MMEYEFITRPGPYVGNCRVCGKHDDDMAMGVCFDCADDGDRRLARKTWLQHLALIPRAIRRRDWWLMRFCVRASWWRITGSGEYVPGGEWEEYR